MSGLVERMNMSRKPISGAYVINNVQVGCNMYDTFCLICAELNINLVDAGDSDFDACVWTLEDFINSANDDSGYTVSVWFD
jgi:hypothetical protein